MANVNVCSQNLKSYKFWPPQDVYFLSMHWYSMVTCFFFPTFDDLSGHLNLINIVQPTRKYLNCI